MSDYHILTLDPHKKTVQVVFHIPVPSTGTNLAGITWQEAVVKEQGGASNIVSVLPGITTEEESALKAGAIIERVESVRFSSTSLTDSQRQAEIEAAFKKLQNDLIAEKSITLQWIGYEGNVA